MKRWFSLFVALCLVLTMLPGVALGAELQTQEEGQQVQLQQPSEEEPVSQEMEPPMEVWVEPERFDAGADTLAGTAQISGTVSLPEGVSMLADGYLFVYACVPPVLDEDGKVLVEANTLKGTRVDFAEGQSSGSYTLTGLAPGDYVLRVYSYVAGDRVLGGELFFNGDGSYVTNVYAAEPVTVSSSSRVDLTLPLADTWISGTVTVDSPVAADTGIRFNCYDDSANFNYTGTTTIKKGQTQAEFSVGVGRGSYPLQLSEMVNWDYAYSDVYGTVSNDYSDRMVYSTLDGPITGLEINATNLIMSQGEGNARVEVTVELPKPLTERREMEVLFADEDGNFRMSSNISVDAGESSFAVDLSYQTGEPFLVGYSDVTEYTTYFTPVTGARYAAENGITTQVDKAKLFTGGTDTQITITEPACYTVTGTMSRSGGTIAQQAAYVLARFDDGETYAGRAVFHSGESQAAYTIYIPQSQAGKSFTLTAAPAKGGMGNQMDDEGETEGSRYTLSGNVEKNLTLPERTPNLYGTISLPQGAVAPEGGLVVEVGVREEYNQQQYATYYIPAGRSSTQYALSVPTSGDIMAWARLVAAVDGVYGEVLETYSQGQLDQADLAFPQAVAVSGNVTVPDSCRDGVAVIQVSANMGQGTASQYVSYNVAVPKGAVSVPYILKLPSDMQISYLSVRVSADTQNALDTKTLYLQPDLASFASTYTNLNITLDQDMKLDIPVPRGVFVSGTLSLEEGLQAGEYTGTIRLEPVADGQIYSEYYELNGTSYDYKISLSQNAVGKAYYLLVYPYEGQGVIPYQESYYSVNGMTSDKSKATPITIGEEGAQIDLAIPKGKVISGSLVDAAGGAVTWNSDDTLWMYLRSEDGQSESSPITVDAEGNWSMTVSPDLAGQFKMYVYIGSNYDTNIIGSRNYYYAQSGVATTESEADFLTIGAGDCTGVKLYVETGWRLSGQIKLPAGGFVTGGEVSMTVWARGESTSYYGQGTVGESGGSYSITVPKESGTYTIELRGISSFPSGLETNVYLDGDQEIPGVEVSGDVSGLDFTLEKGRSVITGVVYRPDEISSDQSISVTIYVDTVESYGRYYASVYISYNQNSAPFTVIIPESDASENYTFSYNTYSNGLASGTFYMMQDGSFVNEFSQRGFFSVAEPSVHSFTPLTILPIATGRIYCPEELTTSMILMVDTVSASGISTFDVTDSVQEIIIGPGVGQQDELGRWYSTYTLGNISLSSGSAYKLQYYSNDVNDVVDTGWHYVNSDGTVVSSMEEAETYYVPYSGTNRVDFTPALWDDGAEDYLLQSDHGFTGLAQGAVYTYTYPGAASMDVTFSNRTDIEVKVNGKTYNPYDLAGQTITVEGDTLKVELEAFPETLNSYYGFAVEQVTAYGVTSDQPGVAAAYTASGSDSQSILSDVRQGEPVRLSLVGEMEYDTVGILAAIYDARGVMLDFIAVPVDLSDGSCAVTLNFAEKYGQAATVKAFLVNRWGVPMMENLTVK